MQKVLSLARTGYRNARQIAWQFFWFAIRCLRIGEERSRSKLSPNRITRRSPRHFQSPLLNALAATAGNFPLLTLRDIMVTRSVSKGIRSSVSKGTAELTSEKKPQRHFQNSGF